MSRLRIIRRHPWWAASVATATAAFVGFVLVYFAPQDLFLQTSLDEPLPAASGATADGSASPATGPAPATAVLARGRFRSGEHDTSGTAKVLRLPDARVFVRLEDLATSNGPAVRVWLSTARAGASDGAVGSGGHVDLGGLKANHGNQNYRVPAGTSLEKYRSVVIWCRRFDVVFGSAPISAG